MVRASDAEVETQSAGPEDVPERGPQVPSPPQEPKTKSAPRLPRELPPLESTASFILEGSQGLRLELLPNSGMEDDRTAAPFAILSDQGRYSRVLLGRVVSRGGSTVREIALKIQKDDVRHGKASAHGEIASNEAIEDLWKREHQNLLPFAEQPDAGVVNLLDLLGSPAEGSTLEPVRPVLYCRERRVYFHPRCPTCGRVLRDCKDNVVTHTVNQDIKGQGGRGQVEFYDMSTSRALYCKACCAHPETRRLYVKEFPPELTASDYCGSVLNAPALYRELVTSGVATAADTAGETPCKDPSDANEGSPRSDTLPCVGCDLRDECRTPDPAESDARLRVEDRLVPLSFYDFYALPLECLHLRYDHAVQIIGGRSVADLEASFRQAMGYNGAQRDLLAAVRPTLDGKHRLLYAKADTKQHTLEVLKLKLGLFRDTCRGLRNVHAYSGPHLDLKPENIMVKVSRERSEVPALWAMSAKVIDLASTQPFSTSRGNEEGIIFRPPHNFHKVYTDPVMKDPGSFDDPHQADFHFTGLTEAPGTPGSYLIHGLLSGGELDGESYSERDAVTIDLGEHDPRLSGASVLFYCERGETDKLTIVSGPQKLRAIDVAHIQKLADERKKIEKCTFRSFRCFHIPCDIFSLGILLLQTLLETEDEATHDAPARGGQKIVSIKKYAETFVQTLADKVERERIPVGERLERLTSWCREVFAQEQQEWMDDRSKPIPWFACQNLIYAQGERSQLGDELPFDLFQDGVIIALRLVSKIEGFSFCRDNSDFDPGAPNAKVSEVFEVVSDLHDRVVARLFGHQPLARDVETALERLDGQFADGPFGDAGPSPLVAKLVSHIRLDLQGTVQGERRVARIHEAVRGTLSTIEANGGSTSAALAALRREFGSLPPDIGDTCSKLQTDLEHVRDALAAWLPDGASPDACDPAEMAKFFALLIQDADAQPASLRELVGKDGDSVDPSPESLMRLSALLRDYAAGNVEDLTDQAAVLLLENREFTVKILAAHQSATRTGLARIIEELERLGGNGPPTFWQRVTQVFRPQDPFLPVRQKLRWLRNRDGQELQRDYFWSPFRKALADAQAKLPPRRDERPRPSRDPARS